jgi:ATP-binding cassette, subfamily C, bacterial PrsD
MRQCPRPALTGGRLARDLSRSHQVFTNAHHAVAFSTKVLRELPVTVASSDTQKQPTPAEVVKSVSRWFFGIGIFSAVVNILMLTGALYMLQIYDRVLSSRSVPTLLALSGLALLAFAVQGLLDAVRMRMLVHIGASYEKLLAPSIFNAVNGLALGGFTSAQAAQPVRDVERVRSFLSSLGPTAILDMPFMPLFLAGCYILHPWLGYLAFGGGVSIILLTVVAERISQNHAKKSLGLAQDQNTLLEASRRNAEAIVAMGFRSALRKRWQDSNTTALAGHVTVSGRTATAGAWAKALRFVLQSAILGLGGYLAIEQQVSPGGIIAASIMMSRALAPIEIAIGSWRNFVAARESHARLSKLLTAGNLGRGQTSLPAPRNGLSVENLIIGYPGADAPVVKGVSFALPAGSALAIFGPSAAGKSSLARALVAVWRPLGGSVRLDGAAIEQFPEDEVGRHIGYLPQDVELLDGTIAENIARFDPTATAKEVVIAAMKAGAHDLILRLPSGYDTRIGEGAMRLSGGQRQRVALARALFRDPFFVVLDEPNSNLDSHGDVALNGAIASVRERGGVVIIITHRIATMASVDHVALMNEGRFEEFGTRDQIMPKLVRPSGRAPVRPAEPSAEPVAGQARLVVQN